MTQNQKEERLLKFILNEIKNSDEVAKLDYKQLADYILQNYWSKEEWGSYECAILDRVIKILFELNEDYKEKEEENKKFEDDLNNAYK